MPASLAAHGHSRHSARVSARSYRISVEERPSAQVMADLAPMTATRVDGTTVLTGEVAGRAEMTALIMRVLGHGLTLVSVETERLA